MRVYYLAECGHHRYLGFPCGTCEQNNTALQPVAVPQGWTAQRLLAQKDQQIDELVLEVKRLREALNFIVNNASSWGLEAEEYVERARAALEGKE